MTTRTLFLTVASFLAGAVCVAAGDDPKADKDQEVQAELKRLEGEWRIVAAEMDGEAVESKTIAKFAAGKCILKEPGRGLPDWELTVKLDPSQKPKWMDVTNPQGKTHRGIYELKGDALKGVFQPDEKRERPTKFETKKGSGLVMFTYQRIKK